MPMWWKSGEKKGIPIAVAIPVPNDHPSCSTECPPSQSNYVLAAPAIGTAAAPPLVVSYANDHDPILYNLQTMGHRTQAHKMFILFSIIAGLTGVNNVFSQLLALTYPGNLHSDVVLRFYAIGFFILVVFIELETIPAIRDSFVVSNWICRGIFYSFLGVLGQDLYDVGYNNRFNRYNYYSGSSSENRSGDYNGYYGPRMPSSEDFAEWYIWLTSFLMFMVGWIYIIMGALCLQWKLKQLREQYQQAQFATGANRQGVSVCACIH